ncbi:MULTISPECIES: DUF4214 domain-containing protein [unclassified Duganella]|uniref:DUF4214 domain-containing protein n=1 Tax=unclassified Duganella TaxID=2636909 RepID=UPI00088CFCEB|nr:MULTISPECIES: DUF4214 domain-containing protein [unclassified Duganella]SDF93433.1 protein of unknown function [Duganella sp. OV458]SDJ11417.1 protein of unknown function [Duganella sp. OV510]
MATTAQISAIQQLYVAYFNRPADAAGLDFWAKQVTNGASLAAISATFAATPEYKALFAGQSNDQIVATIYQNLFNRAPDASGLKFWSDKLTNKDLTIDNVVEAVAASAQQDPAKGPDTVAIQSKVAAAVAFTDFLNTDVESRIAYSSGTVNSVGVNYIHGVTDAATLAAAQSSLPTSIQTALETGNQAVGTTYNLTLNVDTLTGTSSNDLFIASADAATGKHTLGALDSIDGGLGNDTLTVTDAVGALIDLSKASVKNVETLNVVTVDDLAAAAVSVKGFTGLTQANFTTASTAAQTFTGATTTGLSVTNDSAFGVTVVGFGGKVAIETGAAAVKVGDAASLIAANANAITEVSVTGGTTVDITDQSGKSGAIGTKLTAVTVDGATGAVTLTGDALATVSLANLAGDDGVAVGVVNTKAHALTVNLDTVEVGTTATDVTVVTDTTATSAVVNATGDDSAIALVVAKATKITVGGDAGVTLEATKADYTKLTSVSYTGSGSLTANLAGAAELVSIDSSTATGALDITIKGTNAAATPAAQSVTGGAGDDKVTITGTLGKGSVLNLGAGSDTVAVDGGVILGDAVVDAGAGIDTLSLSVVDATNVGAFKNFELFDVANATGVFDQAILDTKNDVTGFVGTGALAGALTVQNLGAGVGFTILGDMGNAAALTLTQATAGALTITSNVDQAKAVEAAQVSEAAIIATNATSLKLVFDNNNIDKLADYANTATIAVTANTATSVSIVSGGDEVNNIANITGKIISSGNDALTSITVTGDQHLTLDYTKEGTLKLATVDASGQTDGGLSFNLADLTAGGTIKLGAGDDVLATTVVNTTGITAATALTVQTINGLEKAAAEDQTTVSGFDVLSITGAAQAADHDAASAGAYSIKDGVYTLGSGVTTLAGAVAQIAANLTVNGSTVVFNYTGTTYVYSQGADAAVGTDDVLVKVTGTTGITGLDDDGAGHIYLIG